MKKRKQQERASAVQPYIAGEDVESICASLGRSRRGPYKWLARHTPDDSTWYEELSRRPLISPHRTSVEIEQIVELVQSSLYNKDLFCGSQAIRWEMEDVNVQPLPFKAAQSILDAVFAVWLRMGLPENRQVDYKIAFFGSPAYPRGMGPLIRLCLHYGVQLWFISPSEPRWNGVIEKFNDHYQQKFLDKIIMSSMPQLRQESLAFEHRHNSTYR